MLHTFHLFQVADEDEVVIHESLDYDVQHSAISADVSDELYEWLQCAVNVFFCDLLKLISIT